MGSFCLVDAEDRLDGVLCHEEVDAVEAIAECRSAMRDVSMDVTCNFSTQWEMVLVGGKDTLRRILNMADQIVVRCEQDLSQEGVKNELILQTIRLGSKLRTYTGLYKNR